MPNANHPIPLANNEFLNAVQVDLLSSRPGQLHALIHVSECPIPSSGRADHILKILENAWHETISERARLCQGRQAPPAVRIWLPTTTRPNAMTLARQLRVAMVTSRAIDQPSVCSTSANAPGCAIGVALACNGNWDAEALCQTAAIAAACASLEDDDGIRTAEQVEREASLID